MGQRFLLALQGSVALIAQSPARSSLANPFGARSRRLSEPAREDFRRSLSKAHAQGTLIEGRQQWKGKTSIMKTRNIIILSCALLCCVLLPKAQTAPESALPGFNTADGDHALFNVTTGVGNAAFGWYSLFANSDGAFNTGVGAGTLALNVGNQSTGEGTQNTAVGAVALLLNSRGHGNTAVGASALLSNDSTGNGVASFNSAFGSEALKNNTDGFQNTAVGADALFSNTTGGLNTAVGDAALFSNTTGGLNTAVGYAALVNNTTSNGNTAVGNDALGNNTTGNGNVAIGASAGVGIFTASNVIAIGNSVPATDVSNTTWITNIFGVTTINSTTAPVIVSQDGQLGTISSSARFKKDIADMGKSSETILSLRPVTFHYKNDTSAVAQFGLIAEEVEKVDPDLIIRDKEGKPYSVRYEAVNAMLLNEFLKEHKKVEQQQAIIAELKAMATTQQATIAELKATVARQHGEMEALTAQLKEQAAQLQKVSAQLELARTKPQSVADR